jgi:hypothetical protein
MVVGRAYPAAGTDYTRTNTRSCYCASTHHGPAGRAASRTDDRGAVHRAAAPHHDLDNRIILLELISKRITGTGNES